METQLTRQQAIDEGFTKCGYYGMDWQTTMELEDLTDDELLERKVCLFNKESTAPYISAEQILNLICDHVSERHYDDTHDDSNEVSNRIKELNFEATAEMVNNALSSCQTYTLTDIQLIP